MVIDLNQDNETEVIALYQISLEAARVNAKLSQREVAEAMKVNVGTISNWENGKTSLSAEQFKNLCELYKCPMDIIFLPSSSL